MVMEVLLLAVEGREPVRLVHIALTLALRANDQGSATQSPARARRRQQIPNRWGFEIGSVNTTEQAKARRSEILVATSLTGSDAGWAYLWSEPACALAICRSWPALRGRAVRQRRMYGGDH